MKLKSFVSLSLLLLLIPFHASEATDRPNIVWLLSEDNSVHYLRLFTEGGTETPRIEGLAQEGLLFERAFSNAPVCSVARTTLMSGIYPPRIAAHNHRALRNVDLPGDMRFFPSLLRDAGYYTTNNSKRDFNIKENGTVFDENSNKANWRNRPTEATPFFHMQTFAVTHEGQMHFGRESMDMGGFVISPEEVSLFPYFPDTPEFRYTHARYLDLHRRMDAQIGQIIDQLTADGLLENTFIFYFGDHGGVLPRSKGYLYETGLHIPLVIRIPENWRDQIPYQSGQRLDGFVSFIDFAPTALRLAGIEPPAWLDGKAFLGQGVAADDVASRDETFGYADRMDGKYDFVRSFRRGYFKYIRNYLPFYPDALNNNYRYNMLAYRQWRDLFWTGDLGPVQRQFFESKPVEALFDLRNDPFEINNLSGDPEYASILIALRSSLQEKLQSLPDLGFFPESLLIAQAAHNPVAFAARREDEIGLLIEVADLMLLPFSDAQPGIAAALAHPSPNVRQWGLIVCSAFGEAARSFTAPVQALLDAPEPLVRMRAAEFLGWIHAADPLPYLRQALREANSQGEAGLILNSVIALADHSTHIEVGTDWDVLPALARSAETGRQIAYLKTRSER